MEELNHLHWNIELHVKVESNKKKMRKLGVKSHEYTPRAKPINNNNIERSKKKYNNNNGSRRCAIGKIMMTSLLLNIVAPAAVVVGSLFNIFFSSLKVS